MSRADLEFKNQTLVEHLSDLRVRLVNCLLILVVATGICYGFSERIFDFVRAPIAPYLPDGGLIYTGPLDKFIAHLKLSFICGILISCPFWLHQIWKFIAPGLYANEKRYTAGFIISGTGLFVLGAAFSYYIALPMAFEFLMHYGGNVDKPMISIEAYMGFFSQMCLMFGVAFELPVVIVVLGMMGVVNQAFLKKNRRYAVMTIAVLAAIITPPDLLSMVMMLIPMLILFESSVILVGIFERKRVQAQNEKE